MKGFSFLEHTADLKFKAEGRNLEKCFANAGRALTHSITDIESIKAVKSKQFELQAGQLDILLHDFLAEILFLFETEKLLFSSYKIEIDKREQYLLRAKLRGQRYHPEKHRLKTEIKAVTFHEMEIKKEDGNWYCVVLCDI